MLVPTWRCQVSLRAGVVATLLVVPLTAACGRSTRQAGGDSAVVAPTKVADTSTAEDWTANCASRHEYRNKLIFTATESTENGQRVVALSTSRAAYVATFQKLRLDGVPELKASRERLLALADKAPGGGRIAIGSELNKADAALWDSVVGLAKAHGVDCLALEAK
jgi:hypothetical protein